MKTINEFIHELNEAVVDQDMVTELILRAWNEQPITNRIEATIKSMNKKDPNTISADILAKSSIMKQICTMCAKVEGVNPDIATRKEFYNRLAKEMVDRMSEYK